MPPPTAAVGIDLSSYLDPQGMDHRPDGNQLLISDRIPPIDPATGTRIPRVDFYDLATSTRVSSTTLTGLPANLRMYTLAYVPARQQIVTHFRRPGNPPDPYRQRRLHVRPRRLDPRGLRSALARDHAGPHGQPPPHHR